MRSSTTFGFGKHSPTKNQTPRGWWNSLYGVRQPTPFVYSPPSYSPHDRHAFPILLLARRSIEEAFESAKEKFQDGEPTEDMVDALAWLESTTDWTRCEGQMAVCQFHREKSSSNWPSHSIGVRDF